MTTPPALPKLQKILVIAMPYLGDVLLATPVLHSLRLAYPAAQLDALVFENSAAMLAGNPDINQIITTTSRPGWTEKLRLFKRIFRGYDLAMALQTGDRPFFYTLFAAPFRVNAVPAKPGKGWWKRFFVQRWTEFDNEHTHTVLQNLKLLELINVPQHFALIPPQVQNVQPLLNRYPFLADRQLFAVLHPLPQWQYKRWTDAGWLEIANYLKDSGINIVLSGGPGKQEMAYLQDLAVQIGPDTINLAGQVSLAELAYIISKAQLFIGPDTGITHLAAATGIPVISIFGPTNPVKWAPWPSNYHSNVNPFNQIGCQQVHNVILVQGEGDCVPCHQEGCDRHRLSHSACLDKLPIQQVQDKIQSVLANQP